MAIFALFGHFGLWSFLLDLMENSRWTLDTLVLFFLCAPTQSGPERDIPDVRSLRDIRDCHVEKASWVVFLECCLLSCSMSFLFSARRAELDHNHPRVDPPKASSLRTAKFFFVGSWPKKIADILVPTQRTISISVSFLDETYFFREKLRSFH